MFGRVRELIGRDLRLNAGRPIFWILLAIIGLLLFGFSGGAVTFASGDSSAGGAVAHVTSMFSQAMYQSVMVVYLYTFFVAVVAGLAIIRDDELRIGELLHATRLRPGEYVWARFAAVLATFLVVLAVQAMLAAAFNHLRPGAGAAPFIGPFRVANYLMPALIFGVPPIVFVAGAAFFLGERTRRPILVFVLPVAVMLTSYLFLINWSTSSPGLNRSLMLLDPSGFRWLNETWLKVDRGVEVYNTGRLTLDRGFLVSRLVITAVGLGAVVLAQRHFAVAVRGGGRSRAREKSSGMIPTRPADLPTHGEHGSIAIPDLALLGMVTAPPRVVRGTAVVARAEIRELTVRPGLYLFVPLIVLMAVGEARMVAGPSDTPAWLTPGTMAGGMANTLALLVCLLLLFYTVESMQRERSTGCEPLVHSTPTPTAAILLGKALGNGLVGLVVLLITLITSLAMLAFERVFEGSPVSFGIAPFLICWGLVLVPTFLAWSAFVIAFFAVTRNRYTSYAIGLAVIAWSVYSLRVGDGLSWVTNWLAWGTFRWSDMGSFALVARPLLLNRLLVLALALFFVALAVKLFRRREPDASRTLHRLSPGPLFRGSLPVLPWAAPALILGVVLQGEIARGYEGAAALRRQKDYWRMNVATWKDAPLPGIAHAALDIEVDPSRGWFRTDGWYRLINTGSEPISRFPVTVGEWNDVAWTLDGAAWEPEDRAGLLVIVPASPLEPGDSLRFGFRFDGFVPRGSSRSGGMIGEFIAESGIVLVGWPDPTFVPIVGFVEQIGVDESNEVDARDYPDDFYEGITEAAFGGTGTPFTTSIRLTAPAEYTMNSVGTMTFREEREDRKTVVWESDHPVRFFNVVGGRWAEKPGDGTVVYYHPEHSHNVNEISTTLDAARRHFSEWFHPLPWTLLKLSEFPDYAPYAQGFPTNITFSEGVGFLSKSGPGSGPMGITAHEAAHQWWGNLLAPGRGPGGIILSEGMASFSELLLIETVSGLRRRIETARRMEDRYTRLRRVDGERPLVRVDNTREGDGPVIYEKGAWVVWMLLREIGRENFMEGIRGFMNHYIDDPDHPVLQDFVRHLRPFAPDSAAYDDFVDQWFFRVVLPEYRVSEVTREPDPDRPGGWRVIATVENAGTGRVSVEVAAAAGERWIERGPDSEPHLDYREARTVIRLGAGESVTVVILCDFEPDRVVVDPDAHVLQLHRGRATFRFQD